MLNEPMLKLPSLRHEVILAPFTTYRIGGPAQYFVEVNSGDDLAAIVIAARNASLPYFVLGCGANILIRDKGIRGLVIHNRADGYRFLPDNRLVADSGATIEALIAASMKRGLSGLEHFVGIPSSVGGAVRQNLHFLAPDRQSTLFVAEIVRLARVLTEDNSVRTVDKEFFAFGYDDSILHHRQIVVLDATFQLTPRSPEKMRQQAEANLAWRTQKQPQLRDYPSCGSVFKKIDGVGAGRLIDRAGLKGKRVGNAMVSPLHANYIVNLGGATAKDVLSLIELVQATVKAQFGFTLEPEIGIVGEV